jgi:predicted MFS family arabinose efflux permease
MILIAGRVLVGIGSSAAILGLFKVIRIGFDEKVFTRMLSIAVMLGLTGALYGGIPISYLRKNLSFNEVVSIICSIGAVLSIITYVVIPRLSLEQDTKFAFKDLIEVAFNQKIIMICILAGLMVGPLEGFADVWGAAFLSKVYQIDHHKAVAFSSMIFLGMCFGSPIISAIADKTRSYFAVIMFCALGMGICFVMLLSGTLAVSMMSIVFIIIGMLSSYQIIAIFKASSYAPERLVGISTAMANMIIMAFGYFFHGAIGKIVSMSLGMGYARAYINGVALIPAALFIALIGFAIICLLERRKSYVGIQ